MQDRIILDSHKLAWQQERVKAWLRGERIAPITVDIALTRRCTYKCVYCYGQFQMNVGREPDRDSIFRFLDDAAEVGVKAVSIVSDGESTCSPHLVPAILRGKANGLDMALGTNGYLLKDDQLEEILPALTYLRFNISAGEQDRYAEIHGCAPKCYSKVLGTIAKSVQIKKTWDLPVTLGLQMVLMPEFADQILPLSDLGAQLGVDYLVIKHCSDDEEGSLGIDYSKYKELEDLLHQAEARSSDDYLVRVKWSKIMAGPTRSYSRCYGPQFMLQISGTGLVAPCGMLFNDKFSKYHIGNIADQSFAEMIRSERYWRIMNELASGKFNVHTQCGTLCLQHKVNEFLWDLKHGQEHLVRPTGPQPMHRNFI